MRSTSVLFFAAAFLTRSILAQPGSDVSVVNTPNVTVANTPGVTIQNTPGVTVVNVPGVRIQNDNASAIPVTVSDGVQSDPQSIIEYRVVGYTTITSTGRIEADGGLTGVLAGYAAMHELCANEFGPNTRAAFTSEALLPTPPLFGPNPRLAWVIPSLSVPWYSDSSAIGAATCGWHEQTTGTTGLALAPFLGRITNASCENNLPIACSAPVAIPVSSSP